MMDGGTSEGEPRTSGPQTSAHSIPPKKRTASPQGLAVEIRSGRRYDAMGGGLVVGGLVVGVSSVAVATDTGGGRFLFRRFLEAAVEREAK